MLLMFLEEPHVFLADNGHAVTGFSGIFSVVPQANS
jgi:hypothetical protein